MALTDPELDLLREILEDDPTDDVFMQVGEELVRRGDWAAAEEILTRGLAHVPETAGFELLARAALECGNYDLSLSSLAKVDTDPSRSPANAQLEILALERAGLVERAQARIDAFLEVDPGDVVVTSAQERLDSPPPDTLKTATDPFLSVERAERYVAVGRVDRAVRAYRRILFRHRDDSALAQRLRQLSAIDHEWMEDDLSEELTDPGHAPPDLEMPAPALQSAPQLLEWADSEEVTEPGKIPESVKAYADGSKRAGDRAHLEPELEDDEDTDMTPVKAEGRIAKAARKRSKRRRRSLLNR